MKSLPLYYLDGYILRRVEEASVRVVTPLRVPDERVPTTRLVVVPLCPLLL